MDKKSIIAKVVEVLNGLYPEADCTLVYADPFQLLVSTHLAAQCTDKKVNAVTPKLFKKYRDIQDFANADVADIEQMIRSLGLYRTKASNIHAMAKMIIEKYNGRVPEDRDQLLKLPGVGRKTANLVLGDAFGIPGIVIDTHARRLANRIGLAGSRDPYKIELELMEITPEKDWVKLGHLFVCHGREVCKARNPKCHKCGIMDLCSFANSNS